MHHSALIRKRWARTIRDNRQARRRATHRHGDLQTFLRPRTSSCKNVACPIATQQIKPCCRIRTGILGKRQFRFKILVSVPFVVNKVINAERKRRNNKSGNARRHAEIIGKRTNSKATIWSSNSRENRRVKSIRTTSNKVFKLIPDKPVRNIPSMYLDMARVHHRCKHRCEPEKERSGMPNCVSRQNFNQADGNHVAHLASQQFIIRERKLAPLFHILSLVLKILKRRSICMLRPADSSVRALTR